MDRLLVPIANPETADRLLDGAIDVAADAGAEIHVLHIITAPPQLSLEHVPDEQVEAGEALLEDAVERAKAAGVEAQGRLRLGRSVGGGIVTVAKDIPADLVWLGWRGRPRRRDIILGSYIDHVLSEAPCDVIVERIEQNPPAIESILVPVAGGPNTTFAAEIAAAMARRHDAAITLCSVIDPGAEESVEENARAVMRTADSRITGIERVEHRVVRGEDVVESILELEADHDLTVLGAAGDRLLDSLRVGDVPERVGRSAENAVMMVKRRQSVTETVIDRARGRIRRLF